MTKVSVDQDFCQGTGFCVNIAETLFTLGDKGIVELVDPETGERSAGPIRVPDELQGAAAEAERACPMTAISLRQ